MNIEQIVIDNESNKVQDKCISQQDKDQLLYLQKYFASRGTKQNPIQSCYDMIAVLMQFGTNYYHFKFGKSVYEISSQKLDNQVWIKLLSIYQNNVRSFLFDDTQQEGSTDKIDIEVSYQLLKLGKDICFSNYTWEIERSNSWILRDFTIEQHTSSTLSKEELFLNYISGKTPTGYEWDQNSPDGFMQISGNFDTFGKMNQRKVNFCDKEPFYIQRNSNITVQIGQKNDQKWIVKFKQDNDFLHPRKTQLPVKYGWQVPRTTWLRIL